MPVSLPEVLGTLRAHKAELRRHGARHVAVFGSVARGEARPESDIDVLVDLDPEAPIGIFEYARLRLEIAGLLGGSADVVNRRTLKPLLGDAIFGCIGRPERPPQAESLAESLPHLSLTD